MHYYAYSKYILLATAIAFPFFLATTKAQPPSILTNLSLLELTYLVNDKTPLQLHLESDPAAPEGKIDIPVARLNRFTVEDLLKSLAYLPGYTICTNRIGFTIMPVRWLTDRGYCINQNVGTYSITNQSPLLALQSLLAKLPFSLECVQPLRLSKSNPASSAKVVDDLVWPRTPLHPVTVGMLDGIVRDWLVELFNSQQKLYWIISSEPEDFASKSTSTSNKFLLSVHSPEDFRSGSVFVRQDAGEQKRRLQEWSAHWEEFNRTIPVTKDRSTQSPFLFKLFATERDDGSLNYGFQAQPSSTAAAEDFANYTCRAVLTVSNSDLPFLVCPVALSRGESALAANGPSFPVLSMEILIDKLSAKAATLVFSAKPHAVNKSKLEVTTHFSFKLDNYKPMGNQ